MQDILILQQYRELCQVVEACKVLVSDIHSFALASTQILEIVPLPPRIQMMLPVFPSM